jgi:hypothetical protein
MISDNISSFTAWYGVVMLLWADVPSVNRRKAGELYPTQLKRIAGAKL